MVDGEGTATLSGEVNPDLPGAYTITYNKTDAAGNVAIPVTRVVTVVDTKVPLISLNGDDFITLEAGEEYTDENAAWSDIVDGSGVVVAEGEVDITSLGTYVLNYNYTDQAGNVADKVIRTINVVDTTAPVISLNGSSIISHEAGSEYLDEYAIWTDLINGTGVVTASGQHQVNVHVLGEYKLFYNITDSNGNIAEEVSRTVQVVDTTAPLILLVGDSQMIFEAG